MKVCLYGTYNYHYSRNSSIRTGLQLANVEIVEVHTAVPMRRMELKQDFSLGESVARFWQKLKTSVYLLSRYQEVLKCDVILVLHPGHLDLPTAWLLAKLGRKKLVFDTSLSPYDTMIVGRDMAKENSLKVKLLKWGEGFLLRLADRLFTDTELMKNFIVTEFGIAPNKVFVVPLGANDKVYFPSKRRFFGKDNKINVLFFGMYNVLHGAQYIVQAAYLLRRNKLLEFVLIGDGPSKQELVDFVAAKKMTNVTFRGFMPETDLVKQIQGADILLGVFANNKVMQRVIPNKIYGSLACKKPLITAHMPVMEEYFVHKKSVYFCVPEDAISLAAAIAELAHDEALCTKLARNSYAIYRKQFTPKQIGQVLLEGIRT